MRVCSDNLQAVVRTGLFMRANRKADDWDAEMDEMGDEDLFGGPGGDDIKKQLRALARQEIRRRVELRLVFLKIGDIDTKEQLFEAEVFLQAKWHEPKLDELADKVCDHLLPSCVLVERKHLSSTSPRRSSPSTTCATAGTRTCTWRT